MRLGKDFDGRAAFVSGLVILGITLGVLWLIHRLFAENGEVEPKRAVTLQTTAPPAPIAVTPHTQSPPAPLPNIHNSPDTECAPHRQCTEEEFADLLNSLRRQWALSPEWLRTKCASNETYPKIEDCILKETVSWLNVHSEQQAPWVNTKNFVASTSELSEEPRNTIAVTARALSVVPGAIICRDHQTVSLMFDWYAQHWRDAQQDKLTRGQSRLIRGDSAPAPDPEAYGCVLVPAGTSMMLERGNIVPVVRVRQPDGTIVRGVTLTGMISK